MHRGAPAEAPRRALARAPAVATALAAGIALGLLALAVDHQPARLLVIVFSSGLSWGAAAIGIGAASRDRLTAALAGLLLLLSAVIAYYVGNRVLNLRDVGWASLFSASRIWGAVAVAGGPVAGLAGWHARFGDRRERPVAWGVFSGLMWGQGVQWAVSYGISPDPLLVLALAIPPLALAYGIRRGGAPYAIPALLASTAASAILWGRVSVSGG